jgi:hypothetical protein
VLTRPAESSKSVPSGLVLNHHRENVAVLERLGAAGAAREFDQGLVRGEASPSRQRRAHAISIEEDHVPGVPVSEGHQDPVLSRLRCGQLHSGIVGESKARPSSLVVDGILSTRGWVFL